MLKIRKCTLEDCGHYSCEIMAYVKPGEDSEIECQLEVEGINNYRCFIYQHWSDY